VPRRNESGLRITIDVPGVSSPSHLGKEVQLRALW